MKYLASSLFFALWAYLFHFYMAQDFTLYLDPSVTAGPTSRPTALWMFLPLGFGIYLFVVAELERRRARADPPAA